ncbi:hypothetical protein K503DRAFT_566878 [Rhizopogon vinicolor AM-OR11-026]|uniref:Uncharacterized protein n=1 Tax=Rhizopogon vinicolor AM-OR11-026 TaxID=1314800 RepID=A0A1B7MK00_9AGAM|nr:hypothetical protein K503DRAFT_566878 [Rhizopogon vinicolor AM-OR11-026]
MLVRRRRHRLIMLPVMAHSLRMCSRPQPRATASYSYRITALRRGGPSTYFQVTASVPVSYSHAPVHKQENSTSKQAVTKLNHVVAPTTDPTPLQPPLAMQLEPVELGRGNIVLSGNSFGECVMINVGSSNCTGSIGLPE